MSRFIKPLLFGMLMGLIGCESPNSHYSRLAMFQSLEHNTVVVVDRLQATDSGRVTAIRISLGHEYDERLVELTRVAIGRGDGDITSKNVKAAWSSSDILKLCITDISENQMLDINVVDNAFLVAGSTCTL